MALTASPFLPKALSEDDTNRLKKIASTFDTFDGPRSISSQNAPTSRSVRSLKEESIQYMTQSDRPSPDLSAPTPSQKYIAQSSPRPSSSEGNKDEDLLAAIENGNFSQVRQLLKKGADPNVIYNDIDASSPLIIASYHGHLEIVELLLDHGAKVDIVNINNDLCH